MKKFPHTNSQGRRGTFKACLPESPRGHIGVSGTEEEWSRDSALRVSPQGRDAVCG